MDCDCDMHPFLYISFLKLSSFHSYALVESQRITEMFLQKKLDNERDLEFQRRQKEIEYEQQLQQQQQIFLQQQQQQQQQFQMQVQQLQQQKQQKKLSLARQSARQVPLQAKTVSIPVGRRSGGLVRKSYLAPIAEGEEDEGRDNFGDSADIQAEADRNENEEIKPLQQVGIQMPPILSNEQLSQPSSSPDVRLSVAAPLPREIDPLPTNETPVLSVRGPIAVPNTSNDSGLSAAARGYMDSMKSKMLVASVTQPIAVAAATHGIASAPSSSSSSSSMSRAPYGEKQEVVHGHGSVSLDEKNSATASADHTSTSREQAVDLSLNSKQGLDFSQSSSPSSSSSSSSSSAAIAISSATSAASTVGKQQDIGSVLLTKEEIGIFPTSSRHFEEPSHAFSSSNPINTLIHTLSLSHSPIHIDRLLPFTLMISRRATYCRRS